MRLCILETNTIQLDGGALFGHTPKVVWEKWMAPDESNRIQLACRSLFVRTEDGRNCLFEAGLGPFFDPKMRNRYDICENHVLLQNLEKIGLEEDDIDVVVLSHLHFDHAGGLLSGYEEGELRLLFPRAKYYVSKEHWSHAIHPPLREKASFIPILHRLLESSGRLVLIENAKHQDLEFACFHLSYGHTVGLLISEFRLSIGPLFYISDLIPGVPWLHLPIATGYDRFAELIEKEKGLLLAKAIEEKGFLFFSHDPNIPCVKIDQDANGKYRGHPFEFPILSQY